MFTNKVLHDMVIIRLANQNIDKWRLGMFFRKKILIISALALLLTTLTAPLGSASPGSEDSSYNYVYKGVNINSDKKLTLEEQSSIYSIATRKNNSEVISPFGHIIGGSGEIEYGPKYETYTNKTEQLIAETIVAWLFSKIPIKKLSGDKKFFAGFVLGKITGWVKSAFKPTYVGYWTTKSYSDGLYRYYLTIVHYEDDTFTQPIDVQYGEVGASTEP